MRRHRHEQTERNDTIFDKKLYSEDSRFVSLQFQDSEIFSSVKKNLHLVKAEAERRKRRVFVCNAVYREQAKCKAFSKANEPEVARS